MESQFLARFPDPVILVDGRRRVVAVSDAAREILGAPFGERDLALSFRYAAALEAVDAVLAGALRKTVELVIPVPVQRTFEMHVVGLQVAAEENSDARAMLVFHDVTTAKRAEQVRVDFVANVSHELRSPLTSLLGFIETISEGARGDPEAQERFLKIMQSEAQRMVRIVDDLLSLSRVEINEHVLPRDSADVVAILKGVVAALSPSAERRGITIREDYGNGKKKLPEVTGDRDEITGVFQNLLDNALKYGRPETEVRVSASAVGHIPTVGGAGVSITFQDSGEGIAPEHVARLTERFYRVDKGRSRDMGGTGLGLAIVKHVVNRHRGRLVIESTPGKGSTFTVFLPTAQP